VHHNEVGFIERGERSLSVNVLARIGEALGVPTWTLLKEPKKATRSSQWSRIREPRFTDFTRASIISAPELASKEPLLLL
jgi:hypothetical protein